MRSEDKDLVMGALDSLGVALAEHEHEWTEGEKEIYEQAVKLVGGRSSDEVGEWQGKNAKLRAALFGVLGLARLEVHSRAWKDAVKLLEEVLGETK